MVEYLLVKSQAPPQGEWHLLSGPAEGVAEVGTATTDQLQSKSWINNSYWRGSRDNITNRLRCLNLRFLGFGLREGYETITKVTRVMYKSCGTWA